MQTVRSPSAHRSSARKDLWARREQLVQLVRPEPQGLRVPQVPRARLESPGQQVLWERRGLLVLLVLLVELALRARQESPGQQVRWEPLGLPEPLALRVQLVELALRARQESPGQQALWALLGLAERQALRVRLVELALRERQERQERQDLPRQSV